MEDLQHARTAVSETECQLNQTKIENQGLHTEVISFKTQLKTVEELTYENSRLKNIEFDLNRTKQTMADDTDLINRLNDKVARFELEMSQRAVEIQMKDEALRQIDVDVREM